MQKFGLQKTGQPAVEPVALALAKQHLRLDPTFTDDDAYVTALITVAREMVEGKLNRCIFNQTWVLSLDQFPYPTSLYTVSPSVRDNYLGNALFFDWTAIKLPWPRLVSVTSITYLANATSTPPTTLPASAYALDTISEPGRIVPTNGSTWPYPSNYTPGSVQVTFVSGSYGDGVTVNNCPQAICQALLLLVGHLYNNREAVVGQQMSELPLAVDALLAPYKFYGLVL